MYSSIKNLVFEGGGILGTAYIGALDYLDEIELLPKIEKVAGASAGAIAACLTCFNIPFDDIKRISSTLNYRKILQKESLPLRGVSDVFKNEFEKVFGDISCVYRLLNNYGWYSTQYFYDWAQKVIATQFDSAKKKPPYTFDDFKNTDIHLNNRAFKDLYIIGTDISYKTSVIFSYETTPNMEVAQAIRISMSVPLLFEAVKLDEKLRSQTRTYLYADGGIMRNYPINVFDHNGVNYETLGLQFKNKTKYSEVKNIVDYVTNLFDTLLKVQEDTYNNDYLNRRRTIDINTGGISALDFNISTDEYKFLYKQGYDAAEDYFESRKLFMY